MKSFFDLEKIHPPYKSEKGVHSCVSCGLYKDVLSPKIKPYGDCKKKIMVIGEAPGETEDRRAKPWQGKAGRALQRRYKQLGVDLFKDCVNINAVNCRPTDKKGNNRTPTEFEIACCKRKVISAIKQYKPEIIILHGGIPTTSIIGDRWKRNLGGIMKWRGWAIPDRLFNAWICPTFHPSFIERQEKEGDSEVVWDQDLKHAFSKIDEPFPQYRDEEECVEIITDQKEAAQLLIQINKMKPPLLAFDIETTGLRPYNREVHKIVCVSFCWQEDKAYAIPFPTEKRPLSLLKRILENPKIGKIAANMKYEDTWFNILHEIHIHPWKFDTMQAAHILDNRPGITSLKFQAYVHFGLVGYDGAVSQYLQGSDSNLPNRITELLENRSSFNELLLYNGMDSLVTFRLAKMQMREMGISW